LSFSMLDCESLSEWSKEFVLSHIAIQIMASYRLV